MICTWLQICVVCCMFCLFQWSQHIISNTRESHQLVLEPESRNELSVKMVVKRVDPSVAIHRSCCPSLSFSVSPCLPSNSVQLSHIDNGRLLRGKLQGKLASNENKAKPSSREFFFCIVASTRSIAHSAYWSGVLLDATLLNFSSVCGNAHRQDVFIQSVVLYHSFHIVCHSYLFVALLVVNYCLLETSAFNLSFLD